MAEGSAIEVDEVPGLAEIADEVCASRLPRLLRREGVAVATISPVNTPSGQESPHIREQLAAFEESFGSWAGFDIEAFLAAVYSSRETSSRAHRPCRS